MTLDDQWVMENNGYNYIKCITSDDVTVTEKLANSWDHVRSEICINRYKYFNILGTRSGVT